MYVKEIAKAQIIMGIKNRMYGEGLLMESITFEDWIKHIIKNVSIFLSFIQKILSK